MDTMDNDKVRPTMYVLGVMMLLGYIILHCVALASLTNGDKEDPVLPGKSGTDNVIAVCGSYLRDMVKADTAIGSIGTGVYLLIAVMIVVQCLSNDSQKISKVVIICVMLAVYGFTMIMLGSFTLSAREDASKIPNCFETIGSPFTHPIQNTTEPLLAEVDPIQNTPEPLLAQVAWCFGIVFILIGGVTLIGTLCYACMRAICFPPR